MKADVLVFISERLVEREFQLLKSRSEMSSQWVNLKAGMTERRNGGITERRKITPNPKRRNRGITERRKIPPNPKGRNHGTAEQRKIPPNPKRQNDGKSPEILKDGITENHPKS